VAGFGTELMLFCGLGYVLLGPRRMHAILRHIAHAKVEFEKTRQQVSTQLSAALDSERTPDRDVP
jgi:Sec-independent protein translocase protein TatA